jgi:hypothetical protein
LRSILGRAQHRVCRKGWENVSAKSLSEQKWRDLYQGAMREKDVDKRSHTFFGRAVISSESILANSSSPSPIYLRTQTSPKRSYGKLNEVWFGMVGKPSLIG